MKALCQSVGLGNVLLVVSLADSSIPTILFLKCLKYLDVIWSPTDLVWREPVLFLARARYQYGLVGWLSNGVDPWQ